MCEPEGETGGSRQLAKPPGPRPRDKVKKADWATLDVHKGKARFACSSSSLAFKDEDVNVVSIPPALRIANLIKGKR